MVSRRQLLEEASIVGNTFSCLMLIYIRYIESLAEELKKEAEKEADRIDEFIQLSKIIA